MNIDFNSSTIQYANQTHEFIFSDPEKNYLINLRDKHDQLKSLGWLDRKVTYTFNKHGFRCKNFADVPSVVFLGCSNTFGHGLPYETLWSTLVANNIGLEPYNLGQGGGSYDTAFRLAYHWLSKIKPKLVILSTIPPARSELHSDQGIEFFNPNNIFKYEDYYKTWVMNDANIELQRLRNTNAIANICHQVGAKFIYAEHINYFYGTISDNDYARDLLHPGIKLNEIYANKILKLIA